MNTKEILIDKISYVCQMCTYSTWTSEFLDEINTYITEGVEIIIDPNYINPEISIDQLRWEIQDIKKFSLKESCLLKDIPGKGLILTPLAL